MIYQAVIILVQTPMLRSDLCDYSDAYVAVKGEIVVKGGNRTNRRSKKFIIKKNAAFRCCILKVNNTLIASAGDLDTGMSCSEYSDNYSITSGSVWNYYRDKVSDAADEKDDTDKYRINNNKTITSKCFHCKTKIIGNTSTDNNSLGTEVVAPLKYLSNFSRFLN